MPLVGFEPTIPASELLQTRILDRVARKRLIRIRYYIADVPSELLCNLFYSEYSDAFHYREEN